MNPIRELIYKNLMKYATPDEMLKAYNGAGSMGFYGHLEAEHRNANGKLIRYYDLGRGLVTNVGVLALANDPFWSDVNDSHSVLRTAKYHATGKGTTAAAATDIKLETVSTQGGQTPVAGSQVLVSAANAQAYRTAATVTYAGVEAVTEWVLLGYDSTLPLVTALTDATGSPFTAGTATSGTITGAGLTASSGTVMGQQMTIFERTSGANLSWGLVTANTVSVITVPAWYLVATGLAGAAPSNTETYVIRPICWDRKVFAAINVVATDTVTYTYTLTINSGG